MNTLAKTGLVVGLGVLLAARVTSGSTPLPVNDREAQRATVNGLRAVGVAMYAWIEDNRGVGSESPCALKDGPADELLTISLQERIKRDEERRLAIFGSDCPLAAHAKVVAALVPKYIGEVPEKDGWGNPYQYVFSRELSAIGIRSPGRDGKYEAETYKSSTVPMDDFDRDLVWWQGFFMRWPSR